MFPLELENSEPIFKSTLGFVDVSAMLLNIRAKKFFIGIKNCSVNNVYEGVFGKVRRSKGVSLILDRNYSTLIARIFNAPDLRLQVAIGALLQHNLVALDTSFNYTLPVFSPGTITFSREGN